MGVKVKAIMVQVERTIKVGCTYQISSSEAYAGLESGLATVQAIIPTEELPNSIDLDVWREFEEDPSIVDQWQWIVYTYRHHEGTDLDGVLEYFPAHEFASHMSVW